MGPSVCRITHARPIEAVARSSFRTGQANARPGPRWPHRAHHVLADTGAPVSRLTHSVVALVASLAITFVAAAIGAAASVRAQSFYEQLSRPGWAPPASVFGPVWTTLYALMAIAAWLAWRAGGLRAARSGLALYLLQLALNALWSWLFFGWRLGAWAFAEVLLLWASVAATLVAFWRLRPIAGLLLVPYLLWVSFAAALTFAVWQRNPALLGA